MFCEEVLVVFSGKRKEMLEHEDMVNLEYAEKEEEEKEEERRHLDSP